MRNPEIHATFSRNRASHAKNHFVSTRRRVRGKRQRAKGEDGKRTRSSPQLLSSTAVADHVAAFDARDGFASSGRRGTNRVISDVLVRYYRLRQFGAIKNTVDAIAMAPWPFP